MSILPAPYQIKFLTDSVGEDRAFQFIETMGGQRIFVPGARPTTSKLAKIWGEDLAIALTQEHGGEQWEIPLLKAWRARYLYLHGYSYNEITCRLGMGRKSVKSYLASAKKNIQKEREKENANNQFELF